MGWDSWSKIIIATPWYGNFAGGAEVAARMYAEKIAQSGGNVEVVTTCCKSPYDSWWENHYEPGVYTHSTIPNLSIRRFGVNRSGKERYEQVVTKFLANAELSDHEKEEFFRCGINSEDLIEYVAQTSTETPVIALPYFQGLIFSLVTDLPQRVHLISCFHDEDQYYWPPTVKMIECCKGLIYLSHEEKLLTIKSYGEKIGRKVVEAPVIGVGVELPSEIVSPIRKNLDLALPESLVVNGIKLPKRFLLYLGRKELGKGVGTLIEWYEKAIISLDENPPLVFAGGGDSSLIPNNENYIDLGFIGEKEKYMLLKKAEALINLSTNESFSLVVMEAWLCETPVIVSNNSEVTRGHCLRCKAGIPVKSELELKKAILDIVSDNTMRKDLGNKGYLYVSENYNWNKVLGRLINAI